MKDLLRLEQVGGAVFKIITISSFRGNRAPGFEWERDGKPQVSVFFHEPAEVDAIIDALQKARQRMVAV